MTFLDGLIGEVLQFLCFLLDVAINLFFVFQLIGLTDLMGEREMRSGFVTIDVNFLKM